MVSFNYERNKALMYWIHRGEISCIDLTAAIFLLAIGANANVGPSGIVNKDGKNVQFSHEFANNIVLIGPSGIVSRDGNNLQLTSGQVSSAVPVAEFITSRGVVGPSGIVRPNGENVQFTQQQVDNFVVTGPSGIVSKDGKNISIY
ncbi:Cuticle protein [Armadillidium vulgare]|nr:Cuticle protein [Armadillidium vulgare]